MSLQDLLYDTWLAEGRVCIGSSLTTPNKKTNTRRHQSPVHPFCSLSLLCTPGRGEREVVRWLSVRLREGEAASLRKNALHDRARKGAKKFSFSSDNLSLHFVWKHLKKVQESILKEKPK